MMNSVLMFCGFYFIVGFQLSDGRPAYFLLMTFLINWAFTSIGEVYAITTPNEEAANGLAGLTTILSVLFMGFLITLDNMPSYWKWANWADLLRYVIQGMCSNELGDNRYQLFDPETLRDSVNATAATIFGNIGDNATNMFLFKGGTDLSIGSNASQASIILNILFAASPSLNQGWNSSILGTLTSVIGCGMENECFQEPIAPNFLTCFIIGFPRPAPCKTEFDDLIGAWEDGKENVQACLPGRNSTTPPGINDTMIPTFAPSGINDTDTTFPSGGNDTSTGNETTLRFLNDDASTTTYDVIDIDEFALLPDENQRETLLCLLNATLPGGSLEEIKQVITKIIKIVSGLTIIAEPIIDIIVNGLPGEVILFIFGWANFEDGELVAPYKWWYCMFAVAMFVLGLEFFKILGTRFIIWTKR